MLSSFVYSLIVWVLFSLLSVILLGKDMISLRGILYFVNTFMFIMPTLSFGILISTLVNNKDSIGGIVNVVGLGSAFCVEHLFLQSIYLKLFFQLHMYFLLIILLTVIIY